MALSKDQKVRLNRLAGRSLARFIGLVRRRSRLETEPPELSAWLAAQHPCIIACWHGQFMMLRAIKPDGVPVKAMVARHADAEVIGEAMAALGIDLIRGAGAAGRQKDRGGVQALRLSVRALEEGASLVMTADVPPGPARRAGEGIVTIARLSGRPIIPLASATTRQRVLNTWSRMTINLPSAKLAFAAGEPIFVPRDADAETLERLRRRVEQSLNEVTERAWRMAGADVTRIAIPGNADPAAPPATPGLGLRTYRHAMGAVRPLAPAFLWFRARNGKEDAARRGERLGRAAIERPEGRLVWVHAASVGETNAVLPVIHALHEARPDLKFLLTTGTVTSADIARRRLGPCGIHQYVPLDAPQYARAFLDHWHPDLAVFTESEIWPNLILETAARRIPIALVNARMSGRSYKRWKARPAMSAPLFNRIDHVLAQNEQLARRFGELGARRVEAVGNLKIDAPPPPVDAAALERLRTALDGRPAILAASTHEGEETVVVAAHRRLAASIPGLVTIIAPRHPDRGPPLAEAFAAQGLEVAVRSRGQLPGAATDIYLADTIGELGTLYALAPVAFIGGSLIPHGGQNPIEAVRHGAVVVTGPHWHNFRDAYTALLKHKGAAEVRNADELVAVIEQLAGDAKQASLMHAGAEAALSTLAGALSRTVDVLIALLPGDEDEGLRRAS